MKIKYQNIRLLAGILGATLMTSILTGCANEFIYRRDKDGNCEIKGTIKYNYLSDYSILEVNNKIKNTKEIYLVRKIPLNSFFTRYRYIDVFNNIEIFTLEFSDNNEIKYYDYNAFDVTDDSLHTFDYIKEIPLDYYLITYDMRNYEYSINDLEELFNQIKEDYYSEESLVKKKTRDN